VILAPGKSEAHLHSLPLSRLSLCGDPATAEIVRDERDALAKFMKRVGMHVIGDFAKLPAGAVHRRFGKPGLILHEWVLGMRELALPAFVATETLKDKLDADDVMSLDALLFLLRQALVRIEARLMGRCEAAKQVKLTFLLESDPPLVRTLELSTPTQIAQPMLRVLRDFLNGLTWSSPLVRLEIEVAQTVPHRPGQLSLLDDMENRFHDIAEYVGRLRARFGDASVGFPSLRESHLPERSWEAVWPPEKAPPVRDRYPKRPLFLFDPPKPCTPPRNWVLVPSENIFSEWWDGMSTRQYFVATNPDGESLWVYWDQGRKEWFLHGTFN
jgi:hypothetical protein